MKFFDNISIAFKSLFNSRKIYVEILSVASIFTMIILCFSFQDSLKYYWETTVKKSIDYRTLFVNYNPDRMTEEEAKTELQKYSYVETVQPATAFSIDMTANDYKNIDINNSFFLVGSTDTPLQIEKGEDLSAYGNQEHVMICAKQFNPYSTSTSYEINQYIDLSSRVGEKFSISFFDSDDVEKFTLVGIYDINQTNTVGNVCYTKWDVVTELNLKYNSQAYNQDIGLVYPLVVVLNDVDNVKKFQEEISKNSMLSSVIQDLDTDAGNKMLSKLTSCFTFLIILFLILNLTLVLKRIHDNKNMYFVMKSIGYSSGNISKAILYEHLMKYLVCLCVSIPIYELLRYLIINNFLKTTFMYHGFSINISMQGFLIAIGSTILMSGIVSIIAIRKMLLDNTISKLKE